MQKRMVVPSEPRDGGWSEAWAEGLALDNGFTIVVCSLLLRMYFTSQVLALYLLKNII